MKCVCVCEWNALQQLVHIQLLSFQKSYKCFIAVTNYSRRSVGLPTLSPPPPSPSFSLHFPSHSLSGSKPRGIWFFNNILRLQLEAVCTPFCFEQIQKFNPKSLWGWRNKKLIICHIRIHSLLVRNYGVCHIRTFFLC